MDEKPSLAITGSGFRDFVICEICGAMIFDHPAYPSCVQRHHEWHESINARINKAGKVGEHGDLMTRLIG